LLRKRLAAALGNRDLGDRGGAPMFGGARGVDEVRRRDGLKVEGFLDLARRHLGALPVVPV